MAETVGQRLQRIREDRGYSRRELDRRASISEGMTSLLERDMRDHYEAQTIVRIAEVLGVTTDWLLRGVGPDPLRPATALDKLRVAAAELVDPRVTSPHTVASFRAALEKLPEGPMRSAWEMLLYTLEREMRTVRMESINDNVRGHGRMNARRTR